MALWTRRLILANVLVYFLTYTMPGADAYLALIPALLPDRPWTLLTYMFVHAGLGHIFFNMLSLWICGPRLEQRLGGGRFLALYFASGIAGGLLSFIRPEVPIIGASGAVFGVMLGFARYWPRERLYLWGVLPLEVRWFVALFTLADLFYAWRGTADGIAHFAHLGGFVGGLLCLLWFEHRSPARRFQAAVRPTPTHTDATAIARWNAIEADTLHEVNRSELERIRQKIHELGVASLTPGDREFLERFSRG
jgi:membrane associated rhomboid family serine protease